ncbi:hypothetical protein [Xylella fastidiosa]|uniref:hypothetical protein n=1 Tax=Xylella fastidiosa TaxID=2371 RepID=UPI001269734C|nr:hypothetical protein [Xylella fastidiosa]
MHIAQHVANGFNGAIGLSGLQAQLLEQHGPAPYPIGGFAYFLGQGFNRTGRGLHRGAIQTRRIAQLLEKGQAGSGALAGAIEGIEFA